MATLTAIDLVCTGRPKVLVFVSSTSAIDTPYYVHLSETLAQAAQDCGVFLRVMTLKGPRYI